MSENSGVKIISTNRKARFDFFIEETLETGIALQGFEVKSLRAGKISLDECVVRCDGRELFLMNAHIPPYSHMSHVDYNPTRTRKLLAHRKEIDRWALAVQARGMTMVALELYFKNGRAKVLVGLAKGKKQADRRDVIKKRESDREIARARGRRH